MTTIIPMIIFDIKSSIMNISTKIYNNKVSKNPENNLPPTKSVNSNNIFLFLLSNTQILFVIYAKTTETNQAIIFPYR